MSQGGGAFPSQKQTSSSKSSSRSKPKSSAKQVEMSDFSRGDTNPLVSDKGRGNDNDDFGKATNDMSNPLRTRNPMTNNPLSSASTSSSKASAAASKAKNDTSLDGSEHVNPLMKGAAGSSLARAATNAAQPSAKPTAAAPMAVQQSTPSIATAPRVFAAPTPAPLAKDPGADAMLQRLQRFGGSAKAIIPTSNRSGPGTNSASDDMSSRLARMRAMMS